MLNDLNDDVSKFIKLQYQPGNSRLIEVKCSHDKLKMQFERITNQWVNVGDHSPYHSVLAEDKYKNENISKNINEFHDTGMEGLQNLIALCLKNNIQPNFNSLFELGCGVGRLTQHFASNFAKINAWDVSPGNLKECILNLKSKNISNVEIKLINSLSDYNNIPEFDVFYSDIVLQHNTPPLQYYILDQVFSKLKSGGVVLFQTITHHLTYQFNVETYLNWKHDSAFEMHALPMRHVMQLFKRHNISVLDVIKERNGGFNLDSNTFLGIRSE